VLQPDPTGESPVTTTCRSSAIKSALASSPESKTYTTNWDTIRGTLEHAATELNQM
jgi:hypothetical protein